MAFLTRYILYSPSAVSAALRTFRWWRRIGVQVGRKERYTNKLIRQYIPKQANFDDLTDKKIASIQKKINNRPRQKLRFETPKAEFYKRIV
jgi:integrase core domain protein